MNKAPTVYIPTEPESNGLTLPLLLSLLAHGIVIGLLIYTYQQPTLETVGALETTMVSPEQLAELQGQIMSNRAAAAEAASSGSASSTEMFDTSTSNNDSSTPNSISDYTEPSSQRVPVFMRSDEVADDMSMNQNQQRTQQMQEYQDNVAEWAARIDEEAMDKIEQVQDNKREDINEERERLKEFRNKQKNTTTPRVKRPNSTDRNIEIETGSSGNSNNTGKNFSLSDGDATASSSSSSSSRSAGGGSRGASNSEILSRIKRNYNPPTAGKGSTQRATLTITVNSNGDVTNVSVSGSDKAVNEAARQAVLNTGNLPIDADDPKYPTFTVQFNGSN